MTNAIILGSGMVGSIMAMGLAADATFDVTIADARDDALARCRDRFGVKTIRADLSDPQRVTQIVRDYDIVLGSLPSRFGLQTLRAVIEAKRNYCDISFMPENALQLDELAKQHDVTAVVDCGVAPGMSNMLTGYGVSQLDECRNIEIYVGGLPRQRRWPFEYKAGFAPHDVIEEYTRPARIVEHGSVVIREALSEPELLDLPGVGTLEAFNTDGLRSLADTLDVPFMKEKTLRYPGHIELMRVFRETGLFSKEPIDVGGQQVRPLDVTAALLFPKWTYEEGEADLTVMRIIVEGTKAGQPASYVWDLLDYYDPKTGARSMSRTTGFACVIVAKLIAEGRFTRPGVSPPEYIGRDAGLVKTVLDEHARRGIHYKASNT